MNIALITAAGMGTRTGQQVPKQFLNVYDKPIIIYTMECFQNHPEIDAIYIACLEGWFGFIDLYAKQFNITKLKRIVNGGATGQESIENVLDVIAQECSPDDIVLVHDGSRPYLPAKVITDNIECCRQHGNGVTAIDTKEAMLLTYDKIKSKESIDREILYRTQTPHSMYLKDMLALHEEAKAKGITGSVATCTLLIECGYTVWFNRGSDFNFKITSKEDLMLFKALLSETNDSWLK
ncbi:MAG: 2-C-methyl-D-erythritol 4-phosphate cytidylyltransferase [Solobacterium sp.]|nr:2-C-methyl-D-erythritol 4-phosphate cytidylyltransferase [Solobacterium sp.]